MSTIIFLILSFLTKKEGKVSIFAASLLPCYFYGIFMVGAAFSALLISLRTHQLLNPNMVSIGDESFHSLEHAVLEGIAILILLIERLVTPSHG